MVRARVLPFSPPNPPIHIQGDLGDLGCSSLELYRVDRRNIGEGLVRLCGGGFHTFRKNQLTFGWTGDVINSNGQQWGQEFIS